LTRGRPDGKVRVTSWSDGAVFRVLTRRRPASDLGTPAVSISAHSPLAGPTDRSGHRSERPRDFNNFSTGRQDRPQRSARGRSAWRRQTLSRRFNRRTRVAFRSPAAVYVTVPNGYVNCGSCRSRATWNFGGSSAAKKVRGPATQFTPAWCRHRSAGRIIVQTATTNDCPVFSKSVFIKRWRHSSREDWVLPGRQPCTCYVQRWRRDGLQDDIIIELIKVEGLAACLCRSTGHWRCDTSSIVGEARMLHWRS